jgi:hypothetical protein
MDASERFLRCAAECERMANFTPSPENKMIWLRMAERWLKIADVIEHQRSAVRPGVPIKRDRKLERNSVH